MINCEFLVYCVNLSSGLFCICSDGFVGDLFMCEGMFFSL